MGGALGTGAVWNRRSSCGIFFTKKVFDLKTAFIASLILATNALYLEIGRYLVIDMVFSFFLVSALFLFYLAVNEEKNRTKNFLLFYLSLALAFLTKGPAAIAITALTGTAYLLFTKRLKTVAREMRWGWGLTIFFTVTLPWFVDISLRQPDFLNFFFLHEHVQRFISGHFEHQEAWFFYLVWVPLAFVPWALFPKPFLENFCSLTAARDSKRTELFLLIVAAGVLVFYSLSQSKLITYVLPSFPFISIFIARGWVLWEEKTNNVNIGRYFYAMISVLAVISLAVCLAMEKMNVNYTTKPFAQFLKPKLEKNDAVFIYDHPGAFYDFGFYLDFPVKLVGLEGELELFRKDKDASHVSVTKEEFAKKLRGHARIFCLMRKSDYDGLDTSVRRNLSLINQDNRKVLVESRP